MSALRITGGEMRALLAEHGIDATKVLADSITETGYETFTPDEEGRVQHVDGRIVATWNSWPEGFDYPGFYAFAKELAERAY